jgi:hypothetical protein
VTSVAVGVRQHIWLRGAGQTVGSLARSGASFATNAVTRAAVGVRLPDGLVAVIGQPRA